MLLTNIWPGSSLQQMVGPKRRDTGAEISPHEMRLPSRAQIYFVSSPLDGSTAFLESTGERKGSVGETCRSCDLIVRLLGHGGTDFDTGFRWDSVWGVNQHFDCDLLMLDVPRRVLVRLALKLAHNHSCGTLSPLDIAFCDSQRSASLWTCNSADFHPHDFMFWNLEH